MKIKRKTFLGGIVATLCACTALTFGAIFSLSESGKISAEAEDVTISGPVSNSPAAAGEYRTSVNDQRGAFSSNGYPVGYVPDYSNMSSSSTVVTNVVNTMNFSNYNSWTDVSMNWSGKGVSAYAELKVEVFVPAGATIIYVFNSPHLSLQTYSPVIYVQASCVFSDKSASQLGGFSSMTEAWNYTYSSTAATLNFADSMPNGATMAFVNDTTADKLVTKYVGVWFTAVNNSYTPSPATFYYGFGSGWSKKYEIVAPVPAKVDTTYDGTCQWITNSALQTKYTWAKDDTWTAKDESNNLKYLNVKGIKYTDTEGTETDLGTDTTKIKEAGTYSVTVGMNGIRWQDNTTADKTFLINVAQKDVGTLTPKVEYGKEDDGVTDKKYYSGTTTSGFPTLNKPDGWSIAGELKWDDDQTLNETGDYNWTFTPEDKNYAEKKGSSQIVVVANAIDSIKAELPASAGNIYTSTTLTDLLSKLTLKKTFNSDPDKEVPASSSEVKWATGTKLVEGENVELTLELKTNSSITCKVTIPKVLAVKPAELEVTLKTGSTVYTSTSLDDLKTMLTVKEINNDGTDGETLEAGQFSFPEGFSLTSGTVTVTVTHTHGEGEDAYDVTGDVTITVVTAGVKSVEIKEVNVPEGVTIWSGAGANTIKNYLTIEVTFADGQDTKKTLDPATDNFTVNVQGSDNNTFTPDNCTFTVTYEGVESSNIEAINVVEKELESIEATFAQGSRKIYSSAKLDDLAVGLTVKAKYNDNSTQALKYKDDYTIAFPKGGLTSTNNVITVTLKADSSVKTTYTVNVTDVAVKSIEVKFEPAEGTKFTSANSVDELKAHLTVTVKYNNNETKVLEASEYDLSADAVFGENSDKLAAGERTITVSYGEDFSDDFTVTVDKAAVDTDGIDFTPAGGDSGDLASDGNGGFSGTYKPDGDFGIDARRGRKAHGRGHVRCGS